MPELPEVETIRRTLAPILIEATILAALPGSHPEGILTLPWSEFARRLRRQAICELERRGKYLALRLASGERLLIHLGMTGELSVSRPDVPTERHCHLALVLRTGRTLPPTLVDRRQRFLLRYHDIRRFGRVSLLTPEEWRMLSAKLGPEPLDPALEASQFWQELARHCAPLKAVLLDQTVLAGVGNIYADEALFAAGLHPLRRSNELTLPEVERLLVALRDVLNAALSSHGTTIRDYRDGRGQPGGYQARLQVYGKRPGTPCPRCGTPLERCRVAGRTTTFCPSCQPLVGKMTTSSSELGSRTGHSSGDGKSSGCLSPLPVRKRTTSS